MKEIVRVNLENEMDLILAHKRAMKLCELCGMSLVTQTSLATAVSEFARCAIEHGKQAALIMSVGTEKGKKMIKGIIGDPVDFSARCGEAMTYAKKLVDDIELIKTGKEFQIVLKQNISFPGIVTDNKIQTFIEYFAQEPALSAYDELRKKNILLQDFAEKLRESENDYRILTDSLPLGIFSVNNRGAVTYTNKWLKDFLGGFPAELISQQWQEYIHPSEIAGFSKELSASNTRQVAFIGQYRFREKDSDHYAWHLISIIPVKNDKQMVSRWTGYIVDIDAQKQIDQTLKDNKELQDTQELLYENQNELQRKVIELNRSNHELEQFAHLATHDLQEPLRKLFFYSDLLKKKYATTIDSSGVTVLNNMTNAAGRMKELINDLLSYSRLQKQSITFEQVDLNEMMSEVLKDLDFQIREKNATVHFDKLPVITGNALRLRQLFNNLISNSLKYSKRDVNPAIEVTLETHDPDITISVKDNGIGFEEKHSEKIFGLFERLHTRDQFPGTGIGLSICRKIAELHHGKISATSVLNEYSKFDITLPLSQPAEMSEAML